MTIDEETRKEYQSVQSLEQQKKVWVFEHQFNPSHYYCRLRELGIDKRHAKKYSERYELEIYKPLIEHLKGVYNKQTK